MKKFCALMALLILVGCGKPDEYDERKNAPWKFRPGQFVESVLTGQRGQVLRGFRYEYGTEPDHYTVRFSVEESRTDTRLLGSDGPISRAPFAEVTMREFELREVSK